MNYKILDHLVDYDKLDALESKYHDVIKQKVYENTSFECSHGCSWQSHWEESENGTLEPYHLNMFTWGLEKNSSDELIDKIIDCVDLNLPKNGVEVHYRFPMPYEHIGFEGLHPDPSSKFWLGISPTKKLYTADGDLGEGDSYNKDKKQIDSRFLWWDETFYHASVYGSWGISISFTED